LKSPERACDVFSLGVLRYAQDDNPKYLPLGAANRKVLRYAQDDNPKYLPPGAPKRKVLRYAQDDNREGVCFRREAAHGRDARAYTDPRGPKRRTGATPVLTLMLLVALHSRRRLCHPQDRGTPARVLSFLSYQSGLAGHGN
jgi:hypothetical protein